MFEFIQPIAMLTIGGYLKPLLWFKFNQIGNALASQLTANDAKYDQ